MDTRGTSITSSILGGVVALASASCSATLPERGEAPETPLISPNRPTFSDGTALVPRDHVQVETGWTFTHRDDAATTTTRHNAPEIVARYRPFDALEVRASWSGYAWAETEWAGASSTTDGGTDPTLAVLVPIVDQDGIRPALVLEVGSTLGVGDDSLTSGHADPTAKLLWSYCGGSLPDWLSIGGNLIAAYPTENGDRFTQTAASLYAAAAIGDTGTSVFAEWYVVAPFANGLDAANTADFGIVQLLGRSTAVDARVGFGLDGLADDWFTGIGFSVLF